MRFPQFTLDFITSIPATVVIAWVHQAIAAQRQNRADVNRCTTLYAQGWWQQGHGHHEQALATFQQLLIESQQLNHRGLMQATLLAVQSVLIKASAKPGTGVNQPTSCTSLAMASDLSELEQLLYQAEQLYHQEQLPAALTTYQQALRQATLADDSVGMGVCLNGIGLIYAQYQQYSQAETYCYIAATLLAETDAALFYTVALHNWGMVNYYQGRIAEAIACFQQALEQGQTVQTPFTEAITLMYLGRAYGQNREYCFALASFNAALALLKEMDIAEGNIRHQIAALWEQIALLCERTSHPDLAIAYYLDAYELYQEMQAVPCAIIVLQHLGQLHENLGDVAMSLHYYRQALQQWRLVDTPQYVQH